MSREPKWAHAKAPTLREFEDLAALAWQQIPAEFRDLARDVLIRVEDFASAEVLASLGIENEFDLMGVYQGVSLERKSVMDIAQEPDTVILFRRPILEYWAEHEKGQCLPA